MTYNDNIAEYNEWVLANADTIIEAYAITDPEAPDIVYECVLDDDYPDRYDAWISNLTIDDVPDDFISEHYEQFLEGGYDDE
jgi:hypothetical protein